MDRRKQEFIKLTNKQINLLNKDLQENQKKQDQLSRELSQCSKIGLLFISTRHLGVSKVNGLNLVPKPALKRRALIFLGINFNP
mgnify:CR=1 FL=1